MTRNKTNAARGNRPVRHFSSGDGKLHGSVQARGSRKPSKQYRDKAAQSKGQTENFGSRNTSTDPKTGRRFGADRMGSSSGTTSIGFISHGTINPTRRKKKNAWDW